MRRPCIDCGKVIERGSRCRRCEARRRGTTAEQAAYRRRVLASTGGKSRPVNHRCCDRTGREVEDAHVEALTMSFARCPGAPYCGHLARVVALGRRMRSAVARS